MLPGGAFQEKHIEGDSCSTSNARSVAIEKPLRIVDDQARLIGLVES